MLSAIRAKPIKVLIRQLSEATKIDVVLGKALRILGQAELFELVRNLSQSGHHPSWPDRG